MAMGAAVAALGFITLRGSGWMESTIDRDVLLTINFGLGNAADDEVLRLELEQIDAERKDFQEDLMYTRTLADSIPDEEA